MPWVAHHRGCRRGRCASQSTICRLLRLAILSSSKARWFAQASTDRRSLSIESEASRAHRLLLGRLQWTIILFGRASRCIRCHLGQGLRITPHAYARLGKT